MKYPCEPKYISTVINKIHLEIMFKIYLGMDIHEQASVAVVGASNNKSLFIKH